MDFKLSPDCELECDWWTSQFGGGGAPGSNPTGGQVKLGIVSQATVRTILDLIECPYGE